MNLTDKQKQWLAWGLLVVIIAVMGFLGVNFPVPVPPTPTTGQVPLATLAPDAFTRFGSIEVNQLRVKNNEDHTSLETHSGAVTFSGAVAANGGLTMDTSAFTVADTTGNVNTAGTLAIGGVAFTGPMKYGTAATYATDARIAHGFTTTPTVCMLWPAEITATVTITATGFTCDTAAHTSPIYWLCGQ